MDWTFPWVSFLVPSFPTYATVSRLPGWCSHSGSKTEGPSSFLCHACLLGTYAHSLPVVGPPLWPLAIPTAHGARISKSGNKLTV
jgi:hypothetical protein